MKSFSNTSFFKRFFLPKSFYGRSLIIVLAPVILGQLFLSYAFFERHTQTTLKQLAKNITEHVGLLHQSYKADPPLFNSLKRRFGYFVSPQQGGNLTHQGSYKQSWLYDILSTSLGTLEVPFYLEMDDDYIFIHLQKGKDLLHIRFPKSAFFSRTIPLVMIFSLSAAFLFSLIALIFLKNQIRPIRRLSTAADQLGKGNYTSLKPEGSIEMRKAIFAFNIMSKRIKRQLHERMQMLAGISHDLRTPLTRLNLQCGFIKDTPLKESFKEDIDHLKTIIDSFIDYVKGSHTEPKKQINLYDLLQGEQKRFEDQNFSMDLAINSDLFLSGKRMALGRCFQNIIGNAKKFSERLWVHSHHTDETIILVFEDDGPGIPLSERQNVFVPFYKTDNARGATNGGSGLGLSIVKNIIQDHGGSIQLSTSDKGGLKILITLPALYS